MYALFRYSPRLQGQGLQKMRLHRTQTKGHGEKGELS